MSINLKGWVTHNTAASIWKGLAFRVVGLSSVIVFSSCTTGVQKPLENSYKIPRANQVPNPTPTTPGTNQVPRTSGAVQNSATGEQGSVGHFREQIVPTKPNPNNVH